jgi:DNA-binding NtrC family response regulator
VLEEREVTRVGGTQPIAIDVRVIAATNRSLREQVAEGDFRADLYYRLNVLSVYLPPLRERKEDIPMLVRRFVKELSSRHDRPFHGISAEAMQILTEYSWPGNVRELRNLIESMVVLAPARELRPEDLPRELRDGGIARLLPVHVGPISRGRNTEGRELEFILHSLVELKMQVEELRRRMDDEREVRAPAWLGEVRPGTVIGGSVHAPALEAPDLTPANTVTIVPGTSMAEIERRAIAAALRETRGNRRKAANMLGIGERTLYRKLKELDMPDEGTVSS